MPLVYTGAPDVVEALVKIARGSLPSDYSSTEREAEDLYAFAHIMAISGGEYLGWARETHVSTSHGVWMDQHAADRGLSRQNGEGDEELLPRLISPPDAITPDSLLNALRAIVEAAGGDPDDAALIEIPVDEIAVVRQSGDPDSYFSFINIGDCRVGGGRGTVVGQVPAGLGVVESATAALRAKRAAGKRYFVEEITPL